MRFRKCQHAPSLRSRPVLLAARSVIAELEGLETRRLLASFSVDPNIALSDTNFHTIGAAISAAATTVEADDTIDVVAGAFAENLVINTPLTLRGAKFGQDPRPGRGTGETEVTGQIAIAAANVVVDGFTVLNGASGASGPTVSAIYINASGATVANNIVTGASTGVGLLAGPGLTGVATLTQNVVGGFGIGAQVVGDGAVSVLSSRFESNSVGVRVDGPNGAVTLGQNTIENNTAAGVEIDLATPAGSANVTLTGNAFHNPGPQLRLHGGDAGDAVTLAGNTVTLQGSATYVDVIAATPVSGLSTTTFTLLRATAEDTSIDIDLNLDGTDVATDATGLAGTLDATGSLVTYVPAANFSGNTSFTFTTAGGASGTVNINVTAENDAPIALDANLATDEDTALTGTLSGNDIDSGSLAYSIVDPPANGTVVITDPVTGAFTFTPSSNYNGTTSFTFQINDGSATSNVATVTIDVASENDAPIAGVIPAVQVDEGQSTTISLSDFFSDADLADTSPDVLTYSLTDAPLFVSIDPMTGIVTIAPGALDGGTYSFTAVATDGSNAAASAAVSLTVNNVTNNPPVITNLPGSVGIVENTTPAVFDVDATDADAGQSLTYSIVDGNAAGLFTIDPATGVVSLTGPLDAEAASQYTLTIRVTDNGPPANEFAQGTLTINVTDENDSPTLVTLDGPITIEEAAPAVYTASATDADVGAVLSYKWFVDDIEQAGETGSTFSIAFDDEGSHVVRVEVSDRGSTPVGASTTTLVTDVAPTVPLSTSVSSVNEGDSFDLIIGPITDAGEGDVASIGQVSVWWQDGTYTLINETANPDLLATLRAGGSVSVSHVFTDGQNATRPITVSVFDGELSFVFNTSIVVNNVAPTGNFAAITPTVSAGASAFVNWFGQTDVSPQDRNAGLRYTYILDVNVPGGDGIYNSGDILVAGDGTYAGSSTATQLQIPGNLLMTAGTYSVLGMLIDKDGSPILTKQISINVTPSTFQVVSLGGDHSGFTVNFNREIDLSVLNLYDGTDASVDGTDVVLTRSTGQSIRGSLVLNATRTGFDFLVTGGILSQGTYTVRLNSSSSAFRDLFGGILDGNYDTVPGGNYVANFGVNAPPGPVLSTPDFSRGPGQPIDIIPGNTNSDLPITMNSPIAVSSINFQMRYDQSLMNVTGIVAGAGLPAGWTVDYSVVTGGVNISLIKSSGTAADIAAGSRELVRVIASVPNSPAIYGKSHVLSFATIVVNGNASIEGTADRSVHKVVFVGDANRDGTLNVGDAGLIETIVLGQVNGFDQYPLIDPVVIVDSSRNSTVDSQDASNAGLSGFTGARPADVPAFTPVSVPVTVGIDPTYQFPTNLVVTPGSSISVPLSVIDDGRGVQSGQLRFEYDTNSLDLINITAGSLLGSGWQILTNINDAEGWVEIAFYHGSALAGASAVVGTLLNFEFNVLAAAVDGVLPLAVASPLNNPLSPTTFYDRQGGILATTALSGSLLIDSVAPSVAQTTFNFGDAAQSFTVVFSEDVGASLAAGDFELLNLTTNTAVEVVVSSVSSDGKTVTLTFVNTGGLTGSILKDGDYRLRIRAGEVADPSGRVNAADVDSTFFFMNADLNHDRSVTFDDLLTLAQHYGQTSGATFAGGDVNYDGQVNFDDLLTLAQRYGTSLAMLPAKSVKAATKKTRFSESVIS